MVQVWQEASRWGPGHYDRLKNSPGYLGRRVAGASEMHEREGKAWQKMSYSFGRDLVPLGGNARTMSIRRLGLFSPSPAKAVGTRPSKIWNDKGPNSCEQA